MSATTHTPLLIPGSAAPNGARPDYWWEQEVDWAAALGRLGLDAFEVLVELEGSARQLHHKALLQVLDDLAIDPGLGELWDELVGLEPWEWLRKTSVYRGLERLAFGSKPAGATAAEDQR